MRQRKDTYKAPTVAAGKHPVLRHTQRHNENRTISNQQLRKTRKKASTSIKIQTEAKLKSFCYKRAFTTLCLMKQTKYPKTHRRQIRPHSKNGRDESRPLPRVVAFCWRWRGEGSDSHPCMQGQSVGLVNKLRLNWFSLLGLKVTTSRGKIHQLKKV